VRGTTLPWPQPCSNISMSNWVMEGEANRSWDLASLHQTSTKEVTTPAAALKAARAPPVAVDDGVGGAPCERQQGDGSLCGHPEGG
jgi:hypothetical protein